MDTYGRITTPDLTTKPEASYGELVDFWNKGNKTIDDLSSLLDSERSLISSLQSSVDTFIELLMQFVESDDIEGHIAEELADIFGRSLTRTITARMNITLDAEVTVPVGYDLDDLHGYLDVEVNPIYTTDIEINGIEVSNIDVEV